MPTRIPLAAFATSCDFVSYTDALDIAVSRGMVIGAYDSASDVPREGLSVTEAADIAREDVSLVYVVE